MRQLDFLQRMRERHGDVFTLRLADREQPLLVVGSPELARQVLNAPADVLAAGAGNRRVLGWLYGDESLILLDGKQHLNRRRLLLPSLHGLRFTRHAEVVRGLAEDWIDALPSGGGAIATLPLLRELTLEVIMRAVLGSGDAPRLRPLREALRALLFPAGSSVVDGAASRRLVQRAEALVDAELVRRRAEPVGAEHDDVLAVLLEANHEDGSPLTDAEVRDELLTLIVAGGDTTAGALAWALERLARNPGALARAAGEAANGAGPYLDAVIHETLRMRPVVPMCARLVKRPFRLGERSVPPGTIVVLSALLIHHRDDVYPQPMSFRPERFLESQPGTYTWIPFGGGTRRCIGASFALMEMRIVLSAFLSRMTVRAAADAEPEEARSRANTLVPARGAEVVLERRGPRTMARSSSTPDRVLG